MADSIYNFTVKDIRGADYPLDQLKGKKVLVVNTASACGLTPQYKGLQELYDKFGGDNFVIIGFPANNFMKQEPGTNEEIAKFCQYNYGVSFPMMSKIDVIGKNQHPLYKYLTTAKLNHHSDSEVEWNFQKYLITPSGKLEQVLGPKVLPQSDEIIQWLTES